MMTLDKPKWMEVQPRCQPDLVHEQFKMIRKLSKLTWRNISIRKKTKDLLLILSSITNIIYFWWPRKEKCLLGKTMNLLDYLDHLDESICIGLQEVHLSPRSLTNIKQYPRKHRYQLSSNSHFWYIWNEKHSFKVWIFQCWYIFFYQDWNSNMLWVSLHISPPQQKVDCFIWLIVLMLTSIQCNALIRTWIGV